MDKAPKFVNTLYIFMSQYCPLNCPYCYIKDRSDKTTISLETVGRALELFSEPPHVVFFGGEPLAQMKLMREIKEKFQDKVHKFQVVTSGYKLREFIADGWDDCLIQVSWDGTPKLADKELLEELSHSHGMQVRCVLHDGNIEQMSRIYQQFKTWRDSGLHLMGDFTIAHVAERREDYAEILQEQIQEILKNYKSGDYLPQTLFRWINNCHSGLPHASCDAGRYLALLPNGDVYPCVFMSQTGDNLLGNVYGDIDWEVLDDIFKRPIECTDCQSPLCNGGCLMERNGSIAKHNCDNMKAIEKAISGCRIDAAQNVLGWVDYYLKEDNK